MHAYTLYATQQANVLFCTADMDVCVPMCADTDPTLMKRPRRCQWRYYAHSPE